MLQLEGGRWMLTLGGILGDHPPTDPAGFLGFARSLRFPDIYETIRDAEPLDDPVAFRFPVSVRHRYERLDRFPGGLLVMGAYEESLVAAMANPSVRRWLPRCAARSCSAASTSAGISMPEVFPRLPIVSV